MSLRFSRVTLMYNDKTARFLVGGAPQEQKDLNGWTAFQDFIRDVRKDDCIVVHVETFLYGGEDPVDATPEEVTYIYMRQEKRADFIETRASKVEDYDIALWVDKPGD